MASEKYNTAEIVLLRRIRNNFDFFSYRISYELSGKILPGQLVEVPFRNRQVVGVVLETKNSGNEELDKLKEISKIIYDDVVLKTWQLRLIKFISERFLVSQSIVASSFVPQIPKRKHTVKDEPEVKAKPLSAIPDMEIDWPVTGKTLIKYRFPLTRLSYILGLTAQLQDGEQALILVPTKKDVDEVINALISSKGKVMLYQAVTRKNKYWQQWQSISSGEVSVIVGTRSAVFAPCSNLKLIIIDQEESEHHKQQEPSPRYRVHEVADFLAREHQAKIIYTSTAPSISLLHKISQKEVSHLELDISAEWPKISIIDQSKEKLGRNYSMLSMQLDEAIESSLDRGKKSFLFMNRRGFFSRLVCRDCQKEIDSNNKMVEVCPACGGPRLSPTGVGVHFAADKVRERFPEAKVYSVDGSHDLSDEEIARGVSEADIIVGTEYVLPFLNFETLDLIGVISADVLLYLHDFSFAEETFQQLFSMTARLKSSQHIFIQTRNPDLPLFSALIAHRVNLFYQREMKERMSYNLPPLTRLIKLIVKDRNEKLVEKRAEKLADRLNIKLESDIELLGPILPHHFQIRGQYLRHIVLKIQPSYDLHKLDFIRGEDCLIDVDPLSLI